MQNGSKIIKVGFMIPVQKEWMGGLNYIKNLFCAIQELNKVSDSIILKPYIRKPDDENIIKMFEPYCDFIDSTEIRPFKYYYKKFFKKLLFKKFDGRKYCKYIEKYDFDITSHNQTEFPDGFKAISWIPDFQHLHLKNMFSDDEIKLRDEMFLNQIKKGTLTILSSQDALEDFRKFAPEYIDKARVMHFVSIINPEIYNETDKLKNIITIKYRLPDKYFYLPNQFWEHKNHKIVFEALAKAKAEGRDINLICTGFKTDYRNANYFNTLSDFIEKNNLKENIKILGLVDNIEVYYLMRNCISIINPSLFEGWSTTVEEAKSLGKNIILSSLNVHKEQNPPEATYFDPNNSDELKEILAKKWENGLSMPDYELEKTAKVTMQERIIEFAHQYKNIILEALNL